MAGKYNFNTQPQKRVEENLRRPSIKRSIDVRDIFAINDIEYFIESRLARLSIPTIPWLSTLSLFYSEGEIPSYKI